MKALSRVIIVGQPNVGKSSLFNRLSHSRQAITSHLPHTTRDQNKAIVSYDNVQFELIDSAGFAKTKNQLDQIAISKITDTVKTSDLVLFMVDGTVDLNNNDLKLSKMVLKTKQPAILLVNKSDKKNFNPNINYFRRLGIESIFNISAQNGTGINDVLNEIVETIPQKRLAKKIDSIPVAILGRPNVGKSALLNKLSRDSIALVSDVAGTTRDINRSVVIYKNQNIEFFDTAGLRRRGKISSEIEYFSIQRTKKAINEAEICLVLIDAVDMLTAQDEHIIGLIKDAQKALIIVVTKWDKVDQKNDKLMTKLADQISWQLQYVWWAPLIFTSANPQTKRSQNLEKLKELIVEIHQRLDTKLPTSKLNLILKNATSKQPPVTSKSHHAKLNYITQVRNRPLTLRVFGTHPQLIHFSYKRYLENQIRQNFDLVGIPIKIEFSSKYKA